MHPTVDLAAFRRRLVVRGDADVPATSDFYALADWAILRAVMGDDLRALPEARRRAWLDALLAQQDPRDGSFPTFRGHSALHANGMAVGAVGALGGRFRHPVRLYEPFADPAALPGWLDRAVDWTRIWSQSHLFWGGVHCFACTPAAGPRWRAAVFDWLEREADPATGWWRRGVAHADRHQGLGGAVHILPLYQHLGRRYPLIERAVDATIAMQLPTGGWHAGEPAGDSYLDLDALYVYALGRLWAPGHRAAEAAASIGRHAALIAPRLDALLDRRLAGHAHYLLALVGILGLHRQLDPERFRDDRPWSDIFCDPALYRDVAPG